MNTDPSRFDLDLDSREDDRQVPCARRTLCNRFTWRRWCPAFAAYLAVVALTNDGTAAPYGAAEAGRRERSSPADSFRAQHGVYFELGGAALAYSVNYDLRFDDAVSARAGFTVLPLCLFSRCVVIPIVPLSIHGLVGDGAHLFEYGGGATVALMEDDDARFWVPAIGYRYQQPEGGFLFRATAMGLFRMNDPDDAIPFAGLSFGYSSP